MVFERTDVFDLMLVNQRSARVPLLYLLDLETAMAPESPLETFRGSTRWRIG